MENDAKKETNSMKNKLINGAYHATHYRTYHSYRKSMCFAKIFLYLGTFFAAVSLVPITVIRGMAFNITAFFLVTYLLYTYFVVSKNAIAKQDSKTVVNQYSVANGKDTVRGWSLYDGAYVDDKESLEVVLTKERTFLGDAIRLIRGDEATLPLSDDYLDVLHFFQSKKNKIYLSLMQQFLKI